MAGKGESALSPRRVEATLKQEQAVTLRAAGQTFAQIAEHLGYTSREGARRAVASALKKHLNPAVDELRALENHRLDFALRAIAPKVQKGDLDAVREWRALIETRARLNGLNKQVDMPINLFNALQIEYVDRLGAPAPAPDWIEGTATAHEPAELEATA